MNVYPCAVIREAEQSCIATGITTPDQLMDTAIDRLWYTLQHDPEFSARKIERIIVYAGKGNNAGDAIGLAARFGCHVQICAVCDPADFSPATRRQYEKCQNRPQQDAPPAADVLQGSGCLLIIDGLLGSGVTGPLRSEYAAMVEEINALRRYHPNSLILSIDIPTGLQADTGEILGCAVEADITAAIGCVKPGMLVDGAEDFVGRLLCIPLPSLPLPDAQTAVVTDPRHASLPPRPYSFYKNKVGRVNIVAGSVGYIGAAQLCADAAVAAGAGLVALYCKEEVYPILAARVAPEVMVHPVQSYTQVPTDSAQALVIGPGIGRPCIAEAEALHRLLNNFCGPVVLDADALNLAAKYHWHIPETAILTPHPGEMRRLFPPAASLSRAETVRRFLQQTPCTLLYKGARTIISAATFPYLIYNSTGGPHMANGGQGDVLSGVIGALVAQTADPICATRCAAYVCGLAASYARAASSNPPATPASALIPFLPAALKA
ncbi:MAG: NAD(P)H-hydrate dehydratase [Akkermansiaceae bacterium]|nr:NAD(P)H-hydrate dehydratase [Akkermansiaceae bacterium]